MATVTDPTDVLLSEAEIRHRVSEMAAQIRQDFPDDLHLVAVLKGAFKIGRAHV